jgi:hypothetical protein
LLASTGIQCTLGCDDQREHNPLVDVPASDKTFKEVQNDDNWCLPSTTKNMNEYSKISDGIQEKLADIFEPYDDLFDVSSFSEHFGEVCGLFLTLFDKVQDALTGMIYPYEKESGVRIYLANVVGRDLANEVLRELSHSELYRTLFDTIEETSSDEECNSEPKIGYRLAGLSEDENDELK